MEQILFVQITIAIFILAVIAYLVTGSEGSRPSIWARVRIPVDQKRRQQRARIQEEEEYEAMPVLQFLVSGIILLLFLLAILGLSAG